MFIFIITLFCALTLSRAWSIHSRARALKFRKKAAGADGERRVGELIDLGGGMDRIDNCVIGRDSKNMAQIDHLVRGDSRLIVMETKNWSGHVSGGSDDAYWMVVRRDGTKLEVQNPLLQVARHAKIVREIAGDGVEVLAVVVMAGRAIPVSGTFPDGVMSGRFLPVDLPGLLRTRQQDPVKSHAIELAWDRIVDHVYAPGNESRAVAYLSWIESRFDDRPWQAWLLFALLLAMVVWFVGVDTFSNDLVDK